MSNTATAVNPTTAPPAASPNAPNVTNVTNAPVPQQIAENVDNATYAGAGAPAPNFNSATQFPTQVAPTTPIGINAAGISMPAGIDQYNQQNTLQEGLVPTSQIEGDITTALATGVGFYNNILQPYQQTALSTFLAGQHLSPQQWAQSQYYRPGLTVASDGINANLAQFNATRYDSQQELDAITGQLPSGGFTWVNQQAANLAGYAMTPLGELLGAPVGDLMKDAFAGVSSKIDELIGNNILRFGAKVAAGAAGGSVTMLAWNAPGTIAQYDAQNDLGEDPSFANTMANLGKSTLFGTALGAVGGGYYALTDQLASKAHAVAVNQVSSGQAVNIGNFLKVAANATRNEQPIEPLDQTTIDNARTQLNNKLNESTQKLNDINEQVNNTDQTSAINKPLSGPQIIAKYAASLNKDSADVTPEDDAFLTNTNGLVPQTPPIQNMLDIVEKDPWMRTNAENQSLYEFMQDPNIEVQQHKDLAQELTPQLDDVNEQLENPDLTAPESAELKLKAQNLKEQLDPINDRLADFSLRKSIDPDVQSLNDQQSLQQLANTDLQRYVDNVDAINTAKNSPPFNVKNSDIRNDAEKVNSAEGAGTFDQYAVDNYNNTLFDMPLDEEAQVKEAAAKIDDLKEKGELDAKTASEVDEANKALQDHATVMSALKDYINCILG